MSILTRNLTENLALVAAFAVVVLSLPLGWLLRRALLHRLRRVAEKSATPLDDALVVSLGRPLPLWSFIGGVYVATRIAPVPLELSPTLERVLVTVLIVSATLWGASFASRLLQARVAAGGASAVRATGVVRYAVKVAVLALGTLVLVNSFGISITPFLTTVGIGGVALALGLQDTLANLVAGMAITLAGTTRVGDFVKLESGEEGTIEDIHWRVTRLRTAGNNVVLIPNNRLAQSVVTNYHLPSRDLTLVVQVRVHPASDLEQVERVTREVGRSIMTTVSGAVPDCEPSVRFHTIAESSIELSVVLRAREIGDTVLVKHEFIKALVRRYAEVGIVIPYPTRTLLGPGAAGAVP